MPDHSADRAVVGQFPEVEAVAFDQGHRGGIVLLADAVAHDDGVIDRLARGVDEVEGHGGEASLVLLTPDLDHGTALGIYAAEVLVIGGDVVVEEDLVF